MGFLLRQFRGLLGALVVVTVLLGPSASAWATPGDGVTWTSRTSAADNSWYDVAYGNGMFVAVSNDGSGNRVMTSPDGITWTSRTSAADNAWNDVTYGNGMFVAVSSTGTGDRVMTSPDGITWTSRTSAADYGWWTVTYGNGQFVAIPHGGPAGVMTSPDGITWTLRTGIPSGWYTVTYGGGMFVAVGGAAVMTSPDGVTWTSRTAAAAEDWRGVTYGNGLFVAVARTGTGNRVMTSPDGITWTSRTSAADNGWFSVAYGNGLFVAVSGSGSGNRVMTSPDGITWTIRTSAADNDWRGVTYGAGVFVSVAISGAGNRVMTNGTFDAVAPGVTGILSGPAEGAALPEPSAAFVVSAADAVGGTGVVGYRCRLDGPGGAVGSWTDCASSHAYSALADGSYTFNVRAVDGAGLLGPVTTRSWRVSSAVPDTRLDESVPTYLSAAGVTLRVSSDQSDATFACRVDNDTWAACSSPATFALTEGVHTLQARAVSVAGVVDPDPIVVSVVIDRTAPQIELEETSVRAGKTTADPGFRARLRSNETGVRFECRLNTGTWTDCTDRPRYQGLPGGRQSFAARAIDRAGNISTEAGSSWGLRGAKTPLALRPAASTPRALCDSTQLTGVDTINYQWRRDRTTLKPTTENYKITTRDSGSRLTCAADVTFASGITATYTAAPILVDQTARLKNFTATTTRRAPVATFDVNEDHLVLIRLWCRSTTRTCKPPTRPTDYQRPARATYTPAGLTKYGRLITPAKKGTNHINLTRFLPNGLPAGDYKLTIRLARRTKGRRHSTTNFIHQDLRITKR